MRPDTVLRRARDNERFGVAERVLALTSAKPVAGRRDDGLTDREREILTLLGKGSSNAQIARELSLSLKTVQNYVSKILEKLQVSNRTQAALKARPRSDGGAV
jgi:DNA-binding NarL/FixJ family response regulator